MKHKQLSSGRIIKEVAGLLTMIGASIFCPQTRADNSAISDISRFNVEWQRATDYELEKLRGGFTLPNGIVLDISIDRVILVNDRLVSSTVFNISENNFKLQNGLQNIATSWSGSGLGAIIQNNLDNQSIKTINTINIGISNLKNLNQDVGAQITRELILPTIK